jgi:hypothetical protein
MLREHSILHTHDVGDDPRRRQTVTAESPVIPAAIWFS